MLRALFKLCFWVVVARWCYAEIQLVFPKAAPVIDLALEKMRLPTHDKWSSKDLQALAAQVNLSSCPSLQDLGDQFSQVIAKGVSSTQQALATGDNNIKRVTKLIKSPTEFSRF